MVSRIIRWNISIEETKTIESTSRKLEEVKEEWNKIKIEEKEYRE